MTFFVSLKVWYFFAIYVNMVLLLNVSKNEFHCCSIQYALFTNS